MYIRKALLIRLLKTLRQPTTGFALLGAHQVGAVPEFPSNLCSTQIGLISTNTLICISIWPFTLSFEARWPKWLEREFTDRNVLGSNQTSASRLLLSRLGQPGSIPALMLPSGAMAVGELPEILSTLYSTYEIQLLHSFAYDFGFDGRLTMTDELEKSSIAYFIGKVFLTI
ncbi:hypothetical protein CSKR_108874 [Clonorchis sinensis]|uniref:Uncharacterized protein n=1 Tax=Clonorchis sinensis TaxID=79923 RepID=A0A3R7GQB7_CLOSI|nr:hypothetical protein CSKR_108874 [Clonorchis sinensis]